MKVSVSAVLCTSLYLSDVGTLPINTVGILAGFAEGLPVGMQIIGEPFSEETLCCIAFAL